MEVIIKGSKELKHLNSKQMTRIKEELTLTNPQYTQAKKYSRYSNVSIPKYIHYYMDFQGRLVVPRGYQVPYKINPKDIIDESIEVTTKYPHFKLQLRETQKEAYKHYIANPDRGMIVLPTGKGKSILGCYIAYRLRQRTLIIVHKDDLVDGWRADSKLCFGDDFKTGLIKAKSRVVGDQLTIATVQTLNRMNQEELSKLYKQFGLVIVDEMHHCSSTSFDLVHNFEACYKIGLTATPERADGLTPLFFYHFGGFCYQYEMDEEDKDILPVEVRVKQLPVKHMPTMKWNGRMVNVVEVPHKYRPRVNFSKLENEVITNKEYLNITCGDILHEFNQGRSIILFLSQKEHCRLLFDTLKTKGVPEDKMQLYYGDSKVPKTEMKRLAEEKEVLITIATYSIATEGTNVKSWEVAFLLSSISSGKNVEQAVGRIRRAKEGKINPVLVYDYSLPHVYLLSNHIHQRYTRYKQLGFSISGYGAKVSGKSVDFNKKDKHNKKRKKW